ncbi:STAS domain-containing protein [Pararhodospirillum oryzae]|uniref:RsbT antagonist protein RsbS n=1 Tax=Pararhodospirillum oryzae TaxID=478448 RepID=A0A512H7H0_9PROT|nr:STAS domain-containing protein [Pararhodospirillum oryzae]GEO81330.1 RsbT antagonist protein RsbS [Pararhodospirillum oryzae]
MRIPILRLGNVLLTSIQADIPDDLVQDLQSSLLGQLERTGAIGVVLDITSLDVIDSYMARVLSETAAMARLMGSEVVITGMNPMVAVTLIEMGRSLEQITTALTLEQGVEKLKARLNETGSSSAGDGAHDRS